MRFEKLIKMRLEIDETFLERHASSNSNAREGYESLQRYYELMHPFIDKLLSSRNFPETEAPEEIALTLKKAHEIYQQINKRPSLSLVVS